MVRVLALLSVIFLVAGCGGGSGDASDTAQGEPGAGTVVAEAPLDHLDQALRDAASSARGMTYRSRSGIDDDNTHVTGSVFVPKGNAPDGGFPVVALAPEVNGTAADCAASLSPNLGGNSGTVQELLKAGFVVFVPDYQGLGKPSDGKDIYHPYLDSTTAGYVIIDGVRAALTMVPEASTSWAALGNYQGGQAAWAANELVANYGSGLELVATASLSPIADFEGLADAAMAGTLTPEQKLIYVAFLAAVKNAYPYDFELDDYRRGNAEQHWDALMSCNESERMGLAAQIGPDDLKPASPEALAAIRGYLQKTTLPQGPTDAPMYVIYGGRDPAIPAAWTDSALTRACQMGDVVQIAFWPDQSHQGTSPVAALGWLGERFKSIPSANDCEAFLASHKP
ncbi:lipase family protein [Mycolicibacterium wolinskyi]|nr:lipase family protein [Mycolicibacterium wolinskyi]